MAVNQHTCTCSFQSCTVCQQNPRCFKILSTANWTKVFFNFKHEQTKYSIAIFIYLKNDYIVLRVVVVWHYSMTNIYTRGHLHVHVVWQQLTVSLHNKKEVEKKRQTLCDKLKAWQLLFCLKKNCQPNSTFLLNRSFSERRENMILSEDHNNTHKQ